MCDIIIPVIQKEKNMSKYEVDVTKLASLNVYQLREVGFKIGVKNPTTMTTYALRNEIMKIALGVIEPYHKKKLGRPRKKELIPDSEWASTIGFDNAFEKFFPTIYNTQNLARSSTASEMDKLQNKEFAGFVYNFDNSLYFFINNKSWDEIKYASINPNLPNYYALHSGDYITCKINFNQTCEVSEITSINEVDIVDVGKTQSLSHQPTEFNFDLPQLKFVNEKCPFSAGQRVCIHGLTASGQTYLCNSFAKNFDSSHSVVLFSIGKKPEEKIELSNGEYYFSTFDVDDQSVVFYFNLLCDHIKQLRKQNKDVVFIVDDINSIMRSIYNHSENNRHQNPAVVYTQIEQQMKKLLACCGADEFGSVTLIVSCNDDEADTQFKNIINSVNKMCNTHILLDRTAFMKGNPEFFIEDETYTENIRNV